MSSDTTTTRLLRALTVIAPPSGWVERAVTRYERTHAMDATTSYATHSPVIPYHVASFDAYMSDAAAYDSLDAAGPRADARCARRAAARIVGCSILFDGADAATAEQAEKVIARALLIARDREPDVGGAIDAAFRSMRDNCGPAEILAQMTDATMRREAMGLPVVEWHAALDVLRAIVDPATAPWVSEIGK
jgi:hypothetical protein